VHVIDWWAAGLSATSRLAGGEYVHGSAFVLYTAVQCAIVQLASPRPPIPAAAALTLVGVDHVLHLVHACRPLHLGAQLQPGGGEAGQSLQLCRTQSRHMASSWNGGAAPKHPSRAACMLI